MKNFLKGLMGIILIIIAVATIFYWELYGRQNFLYEDILVLNKDVNKNELITEEMLEYIKIEQTALIDNVISNSKSIVGKAANNFIPKGAQLIDKYFKDFDLVLKENQYILKIPEDWIKAFPNTLRRGDAIFFYEVDMGSIENNTTEKEIILDNKKALRKQPIAKSVVAYVKDNSNNEVVTLSEEDRYNSSNIIDEIEIITDVETVNTLKKSIYDGKRFIIMYQ